MLWLTESLFGCDHHPYTTGKGDAVLAEPEKVHDDTNLAVKQLQLVVIKIEVVQHCSQRNLESKTNNKRSPPHQLSLTFFFFFKLKLCLLLCLFI